MKRTWKIVLCCLPVLVAVAVAIVFLIPRKIQEESFAGEKVVCVIQLDRYYDAEYGLVAGYNYDLFTRFAQDIGFYADIKVAENGESWIDSLLASKADIVAVPLDYPLPEDSVISSISLDNLSKWVIDTEDELKLGELNRWIENYLQSDDYDPNHDIFINRYEPFSTAKTGITLHYLSPYDEIIRKYAEELGWDWRLLASVVFNESQFRIQAVSKRGATGLMQLMPNTASRYGEGYLFNPEDNIRLGVKHLERLQRLFRKYARNEVELRKFTLAAYNAGEGHILDCINYAKSLEMDYDTWDALCLLIPDFMDDAILEEESVHAGKFDGDQTINYINKIYSVYWAFQKIYKPIPSSLSLLDQP